MASMRSIALALLIASASWTLVVPLKPDASRGKAKVFWTSVLRFETLLRGGERWDVNGKLFNSKGLAFGQLVDRNGNGVWSINSNLNTAIGRVNVNNSYQIANDPDFTSILTVGKKLYHVSNWEWSTPSAHYVTEVTQDVKTGKLSPISFRAVNWSQWGGVHSLCAGSTSPWGTHLAGEEFDFDARIYENSTSFSDYGGDASLITAYARYWQIYNVTAPSTLTGVGAVTPLDYATFKNFYRPYRYGWVAEVKVNLDSSITPRKYYAWGRVAIELAHVMPDNRTVYIADDSYATSLFMFRANPLPAGQFDMDNGVLYAAKATQRASCPDPEGCYDISWIQLGVTSHAAVALAISQGVKFTDLFDFTLQNITDPCPPDYKPMYVSTAEKECLKLKSEAVRGLAAALETRRMAAIMDATLEFSRAEGMALDPVGKVLYWAVTDVGDNIAAGHWKDVVLGRDDMKSTPNSCGAVFKSAMNASWIVTTFDTEVAGKPRVDANGVGTETGIRNVAPQRCALDGIASPDNLAWLPPNNLIIYEDTGRHHSDALWAWDTDASTLTRMGQAMWGAEWTSGGFSKCINGWHYLTAVVQHPYGESDHYRAYEIGVSTGTAAYVGYFPFRCIDIARATTMSFNPIPYSTGVDLHQILTSTRVTFGR